MNWRGRACQIIYFIDFDEERKGHVVAQELEPLMVDEFGDVAARSRKEIVDAENFVTFIEQSPAKVRPEKSRATGDKDVLQPQEGFPFTRFRLRRLIVDWWTSNRN